MGIGIRDANAQFDPVIDRIRHIDIDTKAA